DLPWKWSLAEGFQELPLLSGSTHGSATCVTDAGLIAGRSGLTSAVLWNDTGVNEFLSWKTQTREPVAINESGTIVLHNFFGSEPQSFVWIDGEVIPLPGIYAPTGSLSNRRAYDINESGVIVGEARSEPPDGVPHATRWINQESEDLHPRNTAVSSARSVNDHGRIVGYLKFGVGNEDAFIWDKGEVGILNELIDPTLGWELFFATAINNAGDIVGWGHLKGEATGFLLIPVPPCPADCAPFYTDGTWGNDVVNIDDLLAVVNSFGESDSPCDVTPANPDGTFGNNEVNIDDLLSVINAFGPCP
ncbi:MAG: hypothetical protein KC983_06905, partial [Phycisphaerales bacterium]|nr:hypothetical protein [Phycisphaerales bacterium]